MRHRILVFAMAFPPEAVGSGAYAQRLALGLYGKGVEVTVLAPRDGVGQCDVFDAGQPFEVRRFVAPKARLGRYLGAWKMLRRTLRQVRPQSLWTTNGLATRIAGLAPGRLGVPLVSCMRGTDIVSMPAGGRAGLLPQMRAYRNSVAIAASSDYLRQVAVAKGVEGDKIFFNPSGFDFAGLAGYRPDVARQRQRYPFLEGGQVVLTVARLTAQKRVDRVLKAMGRLARDYPALRYAVAGDGPEQAALQGLAAELGIADRVFWLGRVPPMSEDLYDLYGGAEIFAMAGVGEGLPNVFIEAGVFGLPCVGVDDGGTPEIIADGRTGLLAGADDETDIAAKIGQLLEDPAGGRCMGAAARQRVEQEFSVEALARRSYEVLCRVHGEGRDASA